MVRCAGQLTPECYDEANIAGTKAGTIYGRFASKDHMDLRALIRSGLSLEAILGAGRAVYGSSFDPELTVRALMYFDDLQGPRAARAVKLARIPALARRPGVTPSGLSE